MESDYCAAVVKSYHVDTRPVSAPVIFFLLFLKHEPDTLGPPKCHGQSELGEEGCLYPVVCSVFCQQLTVELTALVLFTQSSSGVTTVGSRISVSVWLHVHLCV